MFHTLDQSVKVLQELNVTPRHCGRRTEGSSYSNKRRPLQKAARGGQAHVGLKDKGAGGVAGALPLLEPLTDSLGVSVHGDDQLSHLFLLPLPSGFSHQCLPSAKPNWKLQGPRPGRLLMENI